MDSKQAASKLSSHNELQSENETVLPVSWMISMDAVPPIVTVKSLPATQRILNKF